ncbi:hypothetical protein ACSBR2_015854 [Camellia fascicularis]
MVSKLELSSVLVVSNDKWINSASTSEVQWENFDQWCVQMKALFGLQELSVVIDLGYKKLVDQPTAATLTQVEKDSLRDNRKKDKKALLFLYQAIDEIVFEKISSATTAKEAWAML